MRFHSAFLDRWQSARQFRHQLSWLLPPDDDKPRFSVAVGRGTWHQVDVVRSERRLKVIFGNAKAFHGERRDHYLYALAPLLNVMSRATPQPKLKAEIGDGSTDPADRLAFSANHGSALLLPDPHFFLTQGFGFARDDRTPQRAWRDRASQIVWRGSSTGWDHGTRGPIDLDHPDCIQRVKLCMRLRGSPIVDAKISTVVAPLDPSTDVQILTKAGLFGDSVPQESWRDHKFAFDIDGNANTYSNLFVRMLYGCCVLKVGSPRGYRQWYYDRLIPWTHFVPVRADLSDLQERIEWCQSHVDECEAIAAAGHALAKSITFEAEMTDAVKRVNTRQSWTS